MLRDSDFAYVDSHGRRRLPIHDAPHVRNALARFNQVQFEDDEARDRARRRLLRAAKKYGIVPIGFMDGQLRRQGQRALPSGAVTFLLTDIQDSTGAGAEPRRGVRSGAGRYAPHHPRGGAPRRWTRGRCPRR